MLRAKLIGGLPEALVGAITGLTEGRFPVAARATYADDIAEREALKRSKSGNAANVVESSPTRRGINIYSKRGAPVIAVNDGVIKAVGQSKTLGRFVVLQDVYGNRYTYSRLGRIASSYPSPKPRQVSLASIKRELEVPQKSKDPKPSGPASAGAQQAKAAAGKTSAPAPSVRTVEVAKERLFAHPGRSAAYRNGGEQQLLQGGKPVAGYTTFEAYFKQVLGLPRKDVVLKPLRPGAQVIGGTVLGRIDKTDASLAPHVHFTIRPAGRKTPAIDPKPILDGWKLLEATAIYRAAGKNPFFGPDARNPTIGQIMLMSKDQLEHQVLNDPRIEIYDCGRRDVLSGQVDRRVLATLKFLTSSRPQAHRQLAEVRPQLLQQGGDGVRALLGQRGRHRRRQRHPDHRPPGHRLDHRHHHPPAAHPAGLDEAPPDHQPHDLQGRRQHARRCPTTTTTSTSASTRSTRASSPTQYNAALKPGQWIKLIDRLNEIDNPVVPVKPSKVSIPTGRTSRAHVGE